ncbi:MAG: TVP38/TMEM64 family protein [Chloroflexi bacterium]|nr:TVP38/TMEM64 family protein [Chloroflexota bacterium]
MATTTSKLTRDSQKNVSFLQRHGSKLIALVFWLILLGGYWFFAQKNDLTLADSTRRLATAVTHNIFGPIFFIVIYWLRPLIFFPATILTVLGGFLFGPIGILYTVIGSNGSALIAYLVGRFFGKGVLDDEESGGLIQRYSARMREDSFETVLIMRLIFLPYDLVNYFSGFLKIHWLPFLLGTAVGSIPGTASFTLLGTSFGTLDELLNGELQINPLALGASVALILGSIAISRAMKRKESASNS